MVEGACPRCGKFINAKPGERARCQSCHQVVYVARKRKRGDDNPIFGAERFTWVEYVLFGMMLFCLPCI
jgi:hypothetical protein